MYVMLILPIVGVPDITDLIPCDTDNKWGQIIPTGDIQIPFILPWTFISH